MPVVTLFNYFNRPTSSLPLFSILLQMKNGKYRKKIESFRKYYEQDLTYDFDQQQKTIPLFSVAGNYRMVKEKLHMISYSGSLLLEIPYLNERDLKTVKMLVSNDPCVMACFENALGNGLVFIVRSCGVIEEHRKMFELALEYYKSLTGVNYFSTRGKSVLHTCMVSLDKHAYIGKNATSFSKHIKAGVI